MRRIRTRFETAVSATKQTDPTFDEKLLDLLLDQEIPRDEALPDTGVGIAIERTLSPIFIRGTTYGTRASTLAYAEVGGGFVLAERGFGPDGVRLSDLRLSMRSRFEN